MNRFGVLCALVVSAGLARAYAAPQLKMDLPDWNKTAVQDRDLGHGVHMLESYGGNIGVLAGEYGVLLVDAEWPQLNDKVRAAVARISGRPVRYLVNTHWHWDHAGGNAAFATLGAVVISSKETYRYIVAAQNTSSTDADEYPPNIAGAPVFTVDSGTQELHLSGQTVQLIHAPPAHTDGDLIVRFVEADVVQTGDTFFNGFYPDIDFEHGGSIDGMIAFYDALYSMCGRQTRVIPGHGPVANREDIRRYQAMLREVRTRVAAAITSGLSEEALIAAHPLDDLDVVWGGNLVKQPYLLGIVYEDLKSKGLAAH